MKKIYLSLIAIIFAFQLTAQTNDVGITEFIDPTTVVSTQANEKVTVRIKNFGTHAQTSIPLSYQRYNSIYQETWTGYLAPGDSVKYTFTHLEHIPYGLHIYMCAYTQLSTDTIGINDTVCKHFYICKTEAAAYISGPPYISYGITQYYSTPAIVNALSYYWSYTPANEATLTSNGNTATLVFNPGSGLSGGVLSVYGVGDTCNGKAIDLIFPVYGTNIKEIEDNSIFLSQNTPNPASANTIIEYSLPSAGNIRFEVLDILGQSVYSKTEKQQAGKNSISLNVKEFKNGIYFYSIEFKGKKQFKKMMVAR